MRAAKIILIVSLVIAALAAGVYFSRYFIIKSIGAGVLKSVEARTGISAEFGSIGRSSGGGLALGHVRLYKKGLPAESGVFITKAEIIPDAAAFIGSRRLSLRLKIDGASYKNIHASGSLSLEASVPAKQAGAGKGSQIATIDITGADVTAGQYKLTDIKGPIGITEDRIDTTGLTFNYSGMGHKLIFSVDGYRSRPQLAAALSADGLDITADITEDGGALILNSIKGTVKGSSGNISGSYRFGNGKPVLSLNGLIDLSMRDICYFSPASREMCDYIRAEGMLNNRISFEGDLSDVTSWEAAVNTASGAITAWGYRLSNVISRVKIEKGVLTVPLARADVYKGAVLASLAADISKKVPPYHINVKIQDVDIYSLVQDSGLKGKDLRGKLFADLALDGTGLDGDTVTGTGKIDIMDANLGPMPILSPLFGNLYGAIKNAIPGSANLEISGGSCTFSVGARKVATHDIKLWGNMVDISAQGYVDFDTNLNFMVENNIKELPPQTGVQQSLVELMTAMGKAFSKAYLTGTLSKPKWKFDYFSKLESSLGKSITSAIRNITASGD